MALGLLALLLLLLLVCCCLTLVVVVGVVGLVWVLTVSLLLVAAADS